jgi:hypothetical protein
MRKAIAIGIVGVALATNRAAAQTVVERAQILRDFQQSVVDYTQQHKCLTMFPEAINAASPARKVFTLPVAMVFRQIIGEAVVTHQSGDVTKAVIDALPALPATLQYRLTDGDLEIRDTEASVVIGVLKDAYGAITVRH